MDYVPNDPVVDQQPYAVWKRLRDDRPLYHNEEHGFWAVSRYSDVRACALDWRHFSSAGGALFPGILDGERGALGNFAFEDPPLHDAHRSLFAAYFSAQRVAALEPDLRARCDELLALADAAGRLDFAVGLGAPMALRAIALLLGVPDELERRITRYIRPALEAEGGRALTPRLSFGIAEYVRWRLRHPGDDMVSALATARLEEPGNRERRLGEQELVTCTSIVAGAGLETTIKLLGWAGYCLDKAADQRARLIDEPGLIGGAVDEVLRFESPAAVQARTVTENLVVHGQCVPAGAVFLLLTGAANRDERTFVDPERLDVGRASGRHLAFGFGLHFCLGNAVGRLLGRVVLEQTLARFPEWEIDDDRLVWDTDGVGRGWRHVPARI